jgi:hypothetical protein
VVLIAGAALVADGTAEVERLIREEVPPPDLRV